MTVVIIMIQDYIPFIAQNPSNTKQLAVACDSEESQVDYKCKWAHKLLL